MTERTAVVFLTHRWNRLLCAKFARLRREIGARADVFVLMERSPDVLEALREHPPGGRVTVLYSTAQLPRQLGFPLFESERLVPGSTHFPVLLFARRCPHYGRVMVVEYDVEYSGDWGDLLDHIVAADADFATMHVRAHGDDPEWYFWSSMVPSAADAWAAEPANLGRSFNPLYLVSRRALGLIEAAHRRGWRAHYEILLQTILAQAGCRILDLAEGESHCLGAEQDPLPELEISDLSTMRWRPAVTQQEFVARSTGRTLFHPVKDAWFYDGSRIVAFADQDARRAAP